MNMPLIRDQNEADFNAVHQLIIVAFETQPYASGNEQFLMDTLWTTGIVTVALVADDAGEIVGQAAFSKVTIGDEDIGWHGCGPVAVLPERHKQGIGSALMRAGLERLRALGSKGCMVVGDPAYYARFGFANTETMTMPEVPPEYFMALSFGGAIPKGRVKFDPAFDAAL